MNKWIEIKYRNGPYNTRELDESSTTLLNQDTIYSCILDDGSERELKYIYSPDWNYPCYEFKDSNNEIVMNVAYVKVNIDTSTSIIQNYNFDKYED